LDSNTLQCVIVVSSVATIPYVWGVLCHCLSKKVSSLQYITWCLFYGWGSLV